MNRVLFTMGIRRASRTTRARPAAASLIAASALMLALASCGGATTAAQKSYTFAVLQPATDPFFTAVYQGAKAEAKKLGPNITVTFSGPGSLNDSQLIADVDALVTKKVSGIIFSPFSAAAAQQPVEAAMKAGVPVAIYNVGIENNSVTTGIAATDNTQAGEAAGIEMCSAVNGASGDVAIMESGVGIPFITDRWTGFTEGLAAHCPGVQVVASVDTNDDVATAETDATSILTAHPNLLGFFADNDVDFEGTSDALTAAHALPGVKLVGFDAEPSEIAVLKAGDATALIAQRPALMGSTALEMLWDYVHGDKNYNHNVNTGYVVITQANLSKNIGLEY
jgi:ribose transport system substrate-binding protein